MHLVVAMSRVDALLARSERCKPEPIALSVDEAEAIAAIYAEMRTARRALESVTGILNESLGR